MKKFYFGPCPAGVSIHLSPFKKAEFLNMFKKRAYSLPNLFADNGPGQAIFQPPLGRLSDSFLILGSSIVFFLFASILLSSLGFLFRIPITSSHFIMAAGFTLLYAILSLFSNSGPKRVVNFSWVIFFLVFSFYLSLIVSQGFFDISYDGQAYHQEALLQLNRGWNPFYEQLN